MKTEIKKADSECNSCDFENAINKSRATWLCPNCGRDFSLEYYLWAEAAHPEWFIGKQVKNEKI